MHQSHIFLISGSSFASSSSYVLKSVSFCFSIASLMLDAALGAKFYMKSRIEFIICFEKATIMKTTWIETLLTAFPIKVGIKKVMKDS